MARVPLVPVHLIVRATDEILYDGSNHYTALLWVAVY